jgi:hypothetical protein
MLYIIGLTLPLYWNCKFSQTASDRIFKDHTYNTFRVLYWQLGSTYESKIAKVGDG